MDNEKTVYLLEKIEKHLDTLVKLNVAQILNDDSLDETEKRVYEMTGNLKRNEICKNIKISPNRLSEIWVKLSNNGLLEKKGNSYKKIIP